MDEQQLESSVETAQKKMIKTSTKILIVGASFLLAGVIYILARPSSPETNSGRPTVSAPRPNVPAENSTLQQSGSLPGTEAANQATSPSTAAPAAKNPAPIDFDFELEYLDKKINAVNASDFGSSELTNSKVGL